MDEADTTPLVVAEPRDAAAIAAALRGRLREAGLADPGDGDAGDDPLCGALVHVVARYAEILVEHLNAAPRLHRDDFLARLGMQPTPALPARAMLAFTPGAAGAVVPAHTPVAAAPPPGEADAVVFETERDLPLVDADAAGAWAVDPAEMRCADVGGLFAPAGLAGEQLFAGALPVDRVLHVAAPEVLGLPALDSVVVEVQLPDQGAATAPAASAARVEWGVGGSGAFRPLAIASDSTAGLTHGGTVVLQAPAQWPEGVVAGIASRWLACRFVPATPQAGASVGPRLLGLRVGARVRAEPQPPEALAWGSVPLDASRDFFPFGERPRFGELFHLTAPALAVPGASIVLAFRLTNPADEPQSPLPPVDRSGRPRVRWEAFTRRGWLTLEATDGTESFTRHGDVGFVLPEDLQPSTLAGRPGPWIRARLAGGHYGAPRLIDGQLFPAAPSVESVRVAAQVDIAPALARRLLAETALEIVAIDPAAPSFEPFPLPDHDGPALCLALVAREPLTAGRELSFGLHPGESGAQPVWRDASASAPAPRWQQRTADGWRDCAVDDETRGGQRPGVVRVRLGADAAPWRGATREPVPPGRAAPGAACWLRVLWPATAAAPPWRRLTLNAVAASQTLRLENEILGSSTGRPGQTFTALRTPIVGAPRLEVREAAAPAPGAWVAWDRVRDFSASDAHARHFVLDDRTGVLRFGDGRQGRIPPPGANNVRLREYRSGGGRRGNVGAGAVAQLRRTVPYVRAVVNHESAAGGQDAGDAAALRRAAGSWLRHRDRAVCADDYVDLCRAASPQVARAWCAGCRDLDPARAAAPAPGVVSLVVLPDDSRPRPQPTPELLDTVRAFLDARRPLGAELVLLGPRYVPVDVVARVAAAPGASAHRVATACRERLLAFLHPVRGNERGEGWAPGSRPHRSDLVAQLGAVDGASHVVDLRWHVDDAGLDPAARAQALVCAGSVEVSA